MTNKTTQSYRVYVFTCHNCRKGRLSKFGFMDKSSIPMLERPIIYETPVLICDNDSCGLIVSLQEIFEAWAEDGSKEMWHDITEKCQERWLKENLEF